MWIVNAINMVKISLEFNDEDDIMNLFEMLECFLDCLGDFVDEHQK